jgi:thiol:disulfide interchange protein
MDTNRLWGFLSSLGQTAILVVLGISVGIFFLIRGLADRSVTAYMILGGMITLAIGLLFVALTIGILFFAHWIQSRQEAREQQRFLANAKEDLAIMAMMQKVQNQQNALLLKQSRDLTRQLPAPNGNESDGGFTFDDAIFDELED